MRRLKRHTNKIKEMMIDDKECINTEQTGVSSILNSQVLDSTLVRSAHYLFDLVGVSFQPPHVELMLLLLMCWQTL